MCPMNWHRSPWTHSNLSPNLLFEKAQNFKKLTFYSKVRELTLSILITIEIYWNTNHLKVKSICKHVIDFDIHFFCYLDLSPHNIHNFLLKLGEVKNFHSRTFHRITEWVRLEGISGGPPSGTKANFPGPHLDGFWIPLRLHKAPGQLIAVLR